MSASLAAAIKAEKSTTENDTLIRGYYEGILKVIASHKDDATLVKKLVAVMLEIHGYSKMEARDERNSVSSPPEADDSVYESEESDHDIPEDSTVYYAPGPQQPSARSTKSSAIKPRKKAVSPVAFERPVRKRVPQRGASRGSGW